MRLLAPAALLLLSTAPALAVQDTPTTINGVETVCTGVGSGKDDPRWAVYPVKVVISSASGHDLAAMQVSLSQNGKPIVQTTCDAPWILFKVPAGHYSATATMATPPGSTRSTDFTASGKGQQEVNIQFPAAAPNQ
jgi:hypothetical protein